MLERLLRNLQRLGVRTVTVLAGADEVDRDELSAGAWARPNLTLQFAQRSGTGVITARELHEHVPGAGTIFLEAGAYCDPRLLAPLLACERTTVVMDSAPPAAWQPLLRFAEKAGDRFLCGAALITKGWLARRDPDVVLIDALREDLVEDRIDALDAAAQPTYLTSLRRDIRPFWFPAPTYQDSRLAERLLLDAAQNGTLDAPAMVHAPIETALVSRLVWTRLTPNQLTFATMILGIIATALFLVGQLWPAIILALVIGVLDGIDGKLARVKVETTELGSWEHEVDYAIETSWWAALGLYLTTSGLNRNGLLLFAILFGTDLLDRLAKKIAKKRTGRNLDDVAPIDRWVRFLGGRRNIYVWLFTIALALGYPGPGFAVICIWGALTAAIHLVRALQIVASASGR